MFVKTMAPTSRPVGHWVEASAGGLQVPEGLYNPVAKYFGTSFKKLSRKK
jgi:hypothetical protein